MVSRWTVVSVSRLRCFSTSSSLFSRMPPCDYKPQQYSEMTYAKAIDVRKTHLSPALPTYYKNPLLIHEGYMQWLYDHTGKRYLDFISGMLTIGVGHCHPKVNRALKEQADKLWHTTNIYLHPKIHEYAMKLVSTLPEKLKVIFLTNSGGEANELAVMMARLYTGNFDIISLRNGYHGCGPFLTSLTSMGSWKYPMPGNSGFLQAMCPDVYRGPWGGANCRESLSQTQRTCQCDEGECQASLHYVRELEEVLNQCTPKTGVAAFIAEPILGSGGVIELPKGYLKNAYKAIRERNGVCISDEVQTGFGHMGSHFWAFETHNVEPDIVTMAKSIGNGFPLAAVATTPEIASTLTMAQHFNTYGGNPLACAVGSAVLDVIEEEGLLDKCQAVGGVVMKGLMRLREEFDIIGDVRGMGSMMGIELVKDKVTKEPVSVEVTDAILESCKDDGLLLGKGGPHRSVLRLKPSLCVTEEDANFALDVLRNSFNRV